MAITPAAIGGPSNVSPNAENGVAGLSDAGVRTLAVYDSAGESSPEPSSSSGEETAGESTAGEHDRFPVQDEGRSWTNTNGQTTPSAPAPAPAPAPLPPQEEEDEGDWVDEEDDEEEEDLLELEFHPSYVPNMEKRKRRFDARWDALQQAVSLHLAYSLS